MREILPRDIFAEVTPYLSSMPFPQVFVQGIRVSFWNSCLQEVAVKAECCVCLSNITVGSCHLQLCWFNKMVLKSLPRLQYFFHHYFQPILVMGRKYVRNIFYLSNRVFLQSRLFFYLGNNRLSSLWDEI